MDELISIIIPVHGEGASAEVCVNSFLLGSVQNIEVLIIAETGDPTADLLAHTYENEPRVTVLVMMASGVSAKRNLGLDHAKGSLIVFADADDYADPDELRTLSSRLGDHDLSIGSFYTDQNGSSAVNPIGPAGVYTTAQLVQSFWHYYDQRLFSPCWNKLYRRSIIESNHLRFPADQYMGEDLIFNLDYLNCCSSVSITDQPVYHYVMHEGQTVFKADPHYFDNQKQIFLNIRTFLDQTGGSSALQEGYELHFQQELKRSVSKICQSALSASEQNALLLQLCNDPMTQEAVCSMRGLEGWMIRHHWTALMVHGYQWYRRIHEMRHK